METAAELLSPEEICRIFYDFDAGATNPHNRVEYSIPDGDSCGDPSHHVFVDSGRNLTCVDRGELPRHPLGLIELQREEPSVELEDSSSSYWSKYKQRRADLMRSVPIGLIEAINIGDRDILKQICDHHLADDCSFKLVTTLTSGEHVGKRHVFDWFSSYMEMSPESVMMLKNLEIRRPGEVDFRFYTNFDMPSYQAFLETMKNSYSTTSVADTSTLERFCSEGSAASIVELLDIQKYSAEEISKLRKQEAEIRNSKSPLRVTARGCCKLRYNKLLKVIYFEIDLRIICFESLIL